MSKETITEEASKLRSNAATSIVTDEFELKDIDMEFDNFMLRSSTSEELADNELNQLIGLGKRVKKFLQQVRITTANVSSAVCASFKYPSDFAAKITQIIIMLDTANNHLKDSEIKLSEFNQVSEFPLQKNIIVYAHKKTDEARLKIKDSLNQLHLLLFGDSQS